MSLVIHREALTQIGMLFKNFDESDLLVKQLAMRLELCKSMTFEKRVDRDSDTECDYTDMPPLEKAKKAKFDTDEDSDEVPPIVPLN